MQGVRLLKEENQVEQLLTEKEKQRLIDCCADHLRPIVITALNTGMRRGEILRLRWGHVDFCYNQIKVEKTKGGRTRSIPMNRAARSVLQFVSKTGAYVFSAEKALKTVKRSFATACRKAGIEKFRFHDLRHTFASDLVRRGIDLVTVMGLLGHSSITVTMRYAHSQKDEKTRAVEALCV